QGDGLLAVSGLGADLEACALQQCAQIEPDDRLVLRNQDPHARECCRKRSGEGWCQGLREAILCVRPSMSDSEFTSPNPLVLRVEISAEQANVLSPLFEGQPVAPAVRAPSSDEVSQRETDLVQREAEFEADVQFREDRIERWR